jgi:flagellar biosynthesis GTPase FlhF
MLISPEFNNPPPQPPFRFREANQLLNQQLQAQQGLLKTQNETIRDAQHMILQFKETMEEMAKARIEPPAQQTLLMTQNQTIHDAQQMMLGFKKTMEEMAKDRLELLKTIEGLKVAQEAEMTRSKVYHLFMTKHHVIHVLGAEGAGVSGHTSKNQACQCNGYSAISPSH